MPSSSLEQMIARPVTWLLVVLASVILPLSMVSTWVSGVVSDTDRYVDTVAPLAEDEVVIDSTHDLLEQKILDSIGEPANSVPGASEGVDRALTRALTGPEFPKVWREANRVAHTESLRVLEDRTPVRTDAGGQRWIQLDLAPIADDALAAIEDELGIRQRIDLSNQDLTMDLVRAEKVSSAQNYYGLLNAAGFWLPIAWVGLIAVTLITARRRLATWGHLAIGALISMAALGASLLIAKRVVVSAEVDQATASADLVEAISDILTRGLWAALWSAAGIALLALVARILIGAIGTRHRNGQ